MQELKLNQNSIDIGSGYILTADHQLGACSLSNVSIHISHVARVGLDQVSIRYIETLTFINGVTVDQHEHALVKVDSECKISLWDQYGDNAEQEAIGKIVQDILCSIDPSYCQQ